MKKNIYELDLFETVLIKENNYSKITMQKVPGGWIHIIEYYDGTVSASNTFIAYNEEFLNRPSGKTQYFVI